MIKKLILINTIILFSFSGCDFNSKLEDSKKDSKVEKTDSSISINDTYFKQQWYLNYDKDFYQDNGINTNAGINANDTFNYSGRGIKIAIIDSGLDVNHKDLQNGAIIRTYNGYGGEDVSALNDEKYAHGTAVTGLIAARKNNIGILGLAYNAEIIFLKYEENMDGSDIVKLFQKAKEFGADIINCSWGTHSVEDEVKGIIQDLSSEDIIIVFAGSEQKGKLPHSPLEIQSDESNIPEVISVGATNEKNLIASYGEAVPNLDLVAPGGQSFGLTTLDPMGSDGVANINNNYILFNDSEKFIGTSAAAPLVTATIALMLEKNPNLTRVEIEQILKNSATKIGTNSGAYAYDASGHNDYYGYGKLNVKKALEEVDKY